VVRAFVDADPEYDLTQIPRINVFLGRRLHSTPRWPGKPRLVRRGAVLVTTDLHHGLVPRAGTRIPQVPNRAYYKFLRQAKRWDEARSGLRQARYDLMREKILSGYPPARARAAGTIIAPATIDAELSDGVTVGRMGERSDEGIASSDATG